MGQACGGRINFSWGDPVRFGAIRSCEAFAQPLEVAHVENLRVGDQGAAIHDAIVAACAGGGAVSLQDQAGTTLRRVACGRPLRPRAPWYQLE